MYVHGDRRQLKENVSQRLRQNNSNICMPGGTHVGAEPTCPRGREGASRFDGVADVAERRLGRHFSFRGGGVVVGFS